MGKTIKVTKNHSIVLGGGCFWCLETYYQLIKGVIKVTSGYAGGDTANPSYAQVSSGKTNHAEVVKIEYDAHMISLAKILEIFWTMHDPTTLNRQGADYGSQYRSIILVNSKSELDLANDMKQKMQAYWNNKIVTHIDLLNKFYPAENYHQDYYAKNPQAAYCQIVINPKLTKIKKEFAELLKG